MTGLSGTIRISELKQSDTGQNDILRLGRRLLRQDVVYGIFDGDRLIATSSLLHDVRAYADNTELSEVMKHSCIEIGESMVLPEYRGNGYMLRLNNLIKDEAKRQGVEYMLATAHPDNIASNTYSLSSWLSSGERVYTMWIQKKSSCSGLE